MNWIQFFVIYILIMNFVGFIIMGIDKHKAKAKKWRIPEKTLFGVSILGGSVGTLCGMYFFRHKTKHWYFVWGMPVILILHIIFLVIGIVKW